MVTSYELSVRIALLAFAAGALSVELFGAIIKGVVKDASGGTVAEAKITLIDRKTTRKSVISDAAGEYPFSGQVEVSAKIDPFDIIPDPPTSTIFGIDKPLQEIPRSISLVASEAMTRYDIRTVNDLVTVTPGSYFGGYFGVPGSLFVRGEAGDNFFLGFRRVPAEDPQLDAEL